MIELPINSFHSIDLYTSYDDIPQNVAGSPTYVLKDLDTNEIIRSGSASTAVDEIGHYEIQLTGSDTAFDRVFQVSWEYSLAGVTTREIEIVTVSTPYATISDILDELQLSIDNSEPGYFPAQKIRAAERLARLQVNVYTGHTFGKRSGSIYVNGTNKNVLTLPERMVSFSKIEQNGSTRYDSNNSFNNLGYTLQLTSTNMALKISNSDEDNINYYQNGGINPPSGVFPASSEYKITGIIGYPYVPIEVSQATILLINDHLYNDGLWHSRYIDRIDTGEMQIRLRDAAFRGTGNLLADNLLEKYKNINIVAI